MIAGHVDESLEPVLELTVRSKVGRSRTLPFVVDTGFIGGLMLPPSLIDDLQLKLLGEEEGELADGSIIRYRIFLAEVEWDGAVIEAKVDESDTAPLLGTALLRGYELKAEMRPRGKLTLKKLPPKKRKT